MKIYEQRLLFIPRELAYGDRDDHPLHGFLILYSCKDAITLQGRTKVCHG